MANLKNNPNSKTAFENPVDQNQQRKVIINQQVAADKAKPKCPLCGKYTDKKTVPQCYGHGGAGSSSSDASDKKNSHSALDPKLTKASYTVSQKIPNIAEDDILANINLQAVLNDKSFNPEIISELLSKRLLLINSDNELATLTIKLLWHPKNLSPEQCREFKKFVAAILSVLEGFKKENGILDNCKLPQQDDEGNLLAIRIVLPTQVLYAAFIQRLASQYLLPIQNINQKAKEPVIYQQGMNHFNPTPYSDKPIPSANRKKEEEQANAKKAFAPKSPADGLKLSGYK